MLNVPLKAKIYERCGNQSDFALMLGVNESLVSRVVRGRRQLPDHEQERWAEVLGAPKEKLFNLERG